MVRSVLSLEHGPDVVVSWLLTLAIVVLAIRLMRSFFLRLFEFLYELLVRQA